MKKTQLLVTGLCAFMMSGLAHAAYPNLAGGTNNITMVDCELLANDIKVVLSNNVVGGVQCNTDDNFVALSVCHTSGLTASRSAVQTEDANGNTICTVGPDETCVETVTGASFPTATSARGTVSSQFPGGACTAESALANAEAQELPED
ncbi:hypothetical protein [Pseudomonas sp. DNDY-54]|uniref:hypothetical protein n=1 Tax=Pseudomonas sp. DNDY-54 TaxID=2870860 RepID=UPI001CA3C49E|nr:hypothetical protein [Pseudomonas sp. DNDY-54]